MPVFEMFTKDLGVALSWIGRRLAFKPVRTLLTFPHYPSRGSTIYKIAHQMGWEVTNRLDRQFDLAIFWEYQTIRQEFGPLESLEVSILNLRSRDISKDVVDTWMNEAFGYSTVLDPESHQGKAVRKSLTNAVHDGTMIQCPTTKEEGFIYQKLIDSRVNDREVMDLRIPVMGKSIPLLYRNYRSDDARFKNVPDRAELELNVDEMLSSTEKEQINAFCELAGLDFCELDVLRDVEDGRIYIVDANNTPQGPPKNLPARDKEIALAKLTQAFAQNFI